ncbi:hypothetical protein CCZ20_14375 [Priestia aryabhattai]|uniref:hypothetical protein n=1 Tax=Priestia aryabhattai TaxID=412384 RepID=UPI000B50071A|nr:hypothetical protein [Priestia aryabhattai]OVE36656.1 hypothetical protein CCZ20_14375 [Priestia aryabhattai]
MVENQIRSDFFIDIVNVTFICLVASCGNSGTGETPQERKQRGGSAAARGKRSLAWKSTAVR